MYDIDSKVSELFELVEGEGDFKELILSQRDLISEISDACREAPIFKENQERYQEFKEGFKGSEDKVLEAYTWFLNRIVQSPTQYHMIASVRLCLPIVDDFIKEEQRGG